MESGQLTEPKPKEKLTGETVEKVMAFFMKQRCRTGELYLNAALQRNRCSELTEDPSLRQQVKASERAIKRGRGPPQRKDPLDFPKMC